MTKSKEYINIKKLSLQTLIIVIISIVCGYLYNSLSDNSVPLIYEPLNLESGSFLTIEQTYQLFDRRSNRLY